jgi:exodeoxyribonuclease V alpha subunit
LADAAYSTIQGTLERITYVNEENQYVVGRLQVPGRRDLATIVGNLPAVNPGETLRLHGRWTLHKKYGEQFQVDRFETVTPSTVLGIERYLGSGLIKGIGPVFAKRLVEAFALDTLTVIDAQPDRLLEVEGIGPVRHGRICRAWNEQREIRQVMLFLQEHGVSPAYAVKIFKHYGQDSIAVVKDDPYRLAQDIYGIGFKTADGIAQKLGVPKDSPGRAQAGVVHALNELTDAGHLYFPRPGLVEECAEMLEVEAPAVEAALQALREKERIVVEDGPDGAGVYLQSLYQAEVRAAQRLQDIARAPRLQVPIDVEKAIEWAQERGGLTLAAQQREAIRRAIERKLVVVTGGPGTGKTTILRCLLPILEAKKLRVALAAPTGRAAKRMAEATGREAKTLHRLLEFSPRDGQFQRTLDRPLEADWVVVDEASMLDLPLAYALLRAVPLQAGLVLVGDVDQLPSVGPGTVLKDIIASGVAEVIQLTEIFRQAEASQIVVNAHRVNQGAMPLAPRDGGGDFLFFEEEEPEAVQRRILDLVTRDLPRRHGLDPWEDIQVITPMHRGPIGAGQLNTALQAALNPRGTEVVRGTRLFRTGDKVMQLRNNYDKDVFNGDIGRIRRIDLEEQEVHIRFDDRVVPFEFADLDELTLAYAITVHKSQGSEYPAAVVPIHTHHFVLLQRNLLYTAITRARRLLALVGTRKATAIAVKNDKTQRRYSRLLPRLQGHLVGGV